MGDLWVCGALLVLLVYVCFAEFCFLFCWLFLILVIYCLRVTFAGLLFKCVSVLLV